MGDIKRRFSGRAFASVLVAAGFVALLASGLVLFVAPPGRVANWGGWRLIGLAKHEWGAIHIWFAVLFVIGAIFHLIFNLRPMLNYFRDRLSRKFSYRREWLAALTVCFLVFVGTKAELPPFGTLLAFNEDVKNSWEKQDKAAAPIPHAELLTLKELAEAGNVSFDVSVQRLESRGFTGITADTIIAHLAATNASTPQRVYEIITASHGYGRGSGETNVTRSAGSPHREGSGKGGSGGGYGAGSGGSGRKTLAEYCSGRGLDLAEAIARLESAGIKVKADRSLREIALDHGYERPYEIIDILEGRK